MVEAADVESADRADSSRPPQIWGLDSEQLHDAWWRGRGVQCVRMGQRFQPVEGAELYLLLEPSQLVTFDLDQLAELIVWSSAIAFWITVVERGDEPYREEILRGSEGAVLGIRRSYAYEERAGHRGVLTTSDALARAWSTSETRSEARAEVEEHSGSRLVHESVYGHSYDLGLPEDHREFLAWLVATWSDPDRVLEGIEAIRPGVFAQVGTNLPDGGLYLEPLWLGVEERRGSGEVLVGPDFTTDDRCDDSGDIVMRTINEIDPPKGKRGGRLLPRQGVYDLAKRSFDILMSASVLLCFSPLMLLVCLAVCIDDGFPLFFGHTRQKKDGKEFKCWKFRTMRRNAEAMVAELQAMNKADGPQVYIEDDPRVTRVGRILRKFQLDELPQFWNVLRGDMSVVGPRPSPDRENQFCPAWREMRLSVRPGITGLWQVERTRTPGEDFQEWIKYDIRYVRNATFLLDLKIILKTAVNIIR